MILWNILWGVSMLLYLKSTPATDWSKTIIQTWTISSEHHVWVDFSLSNSLCFTSSTSSWWCSQGLSLPCKQRKRIQSLNTTATTHMWCDYISVREFSHDCYLPHVYIMNTWLKISRTIRDRRRKRGIKLSLIFMELQRIPHYSLWPVE